MFFLNSHSLSSLLSLHSICSCITLYPLMSNSGNRCQLMTHKLVNLSFIVVYSCSIAMENEFVGEFVCCA